MKLPETFTIQVTKEDIDEANLQIVGGASRCHNCPIARAITRVLKEYVLVGGYASVYSKDNPKACDLIARYTLPPEGTEFITQFDSSVLPKPVELTLVKMRNC